MRKIEKYVESFKDVLFSYLRVHNKMSVAHRMGISRTTLYRMTSPKGNPTLNNIFSLLEAIDTKKAA